MEQKTLIFHEDWLIIKQKIQETEKNLRDIQVLVYRLEDSIKFLLVAGHDKMI